MIPYKIICRGGDWVTPSLLCINWPATPHIVYHQRGSVAISVKSKLYSTGPLITEFPHRGCTVILIEFIECINEEEPPVLLLGILFLQHYHGVYTTLYTSFCTFVDLVCPTNIIGLCARNFQYTFSVILLRVYLTPTGYTSRLLSRLIRLLSIKSQ